MSLNQRAHELVEQAISHSDQLGIASLDDGINVPVVDFGIRVPGSLGAGVVLAEICTAGLATVRIENGVPEVWRGPAISLHTDQPVAACLAAQYAGWKLTHEDFFAMGSGPMRACCGAEALYDQIGLRESPNLAVGVLETRQFPSPFLCRSIATDCDVEHRKLTLLVAPTASLAGTVQIVARTVETALHKMHELGFDVNQTISGWGTAPLPPVAADDLVAIGRTNDAVLYGGQVQLWVRGDDDELAELIPRVPSMASDDHGRPFAEIYQACGSDFYQIDPQLFSPAWIRVNNLNSGRSFEAGQILPDVIRRSFES